MTEPTWKEALLNRRMLICIFTGFSSGLPLYLLLNLVPAWLRTEGISLKAIGLFALIQLPYTWKFLWSPFLDRYALPWLGRRRGWMAATQLALLALIAMLGLFSPRIDLQVIVVLASLLAFVSATQDIVLDAYRRELLPEHELGLGNSVHVNAYRIAGLVPGSLSLILADHLAWGEVFAVTALFMLPGLAMSLMVSEQVSPGGKARTLREAVVEPFREFLTRAGWREALLVLAFIFLYKLGDSLYTALATPFYLDMGFAKSEIGLVAKHAGLWPAVIGGLLGGLWMVKLGINRALWLFGVVQLVSIFGFAWLAWLGPNTIVGAAQLGQLALVIGFEALGVGLGTAAFVAFISRATNPLYTATQFALFTSLAAAPRTLINAGAGVLVEQLGWFAFFLLCAALAVPGMLLLVKWRRGARPTLEFFSFVTIQPLGKAVVILNTTAHFPQWRPKMLVVMDMSSGKIEQQIEAMEPEFGSFEDEVLNAEWQRPELQLGLQPVAIHHDPVPAEAEVESFLKNVYLSQE